MNGDLHRSGSFARQGNNEEIELIRIRECNNLSEENCCICLSEPYFSRSFIKMYCCNQTLHKECFLEWINYPIHKNSDYNNKLHCVICKTKIENFDEIITLGEFINYIETKTYYRNNDSLVLHYKKIISELYKDSFVKIIINSDTFTDSVDTQQSIFDLTYCFCNIFCIFFFLIMIMIMILIGNILVKK